AHHSGMGRRMETEFHGWYEEQRDRPQVILGRIGNGAGTETRPYRRAIDWTGRESGGSPDVGDQPGSHARHKSGISLKLVAEHPFLEYRTYRDHHNDDKPGCQPIP